MSDDEEKRIIVLPQDPFNLGSDFAPPIRETCTGPSKCMLCKLTGYHNHSPKSKEVLAKQAAIGFLVIIIMLFILIATLVLALRMIGLFR